MSEGSGEAADALRAADLDRRIDVAYGDVAFDQPDQWGDLDTFLGAAM